MHAALRLNALMTANLHGLMCGQQGAPLLLLCEAKSASAVKRMTAVKSHLCVGVAARLNVLRPRRERNKSYKARSLWKEVAATARVQPAVLLLLADFVSASCWRERRVIGCGHTEAGAGAGGGPAAISRVFLRLPLCGEPVCNRWAYGLRGCGRLVCLMCEFLRVSPSCVSVCESGSGYVRGPQIPCNLL